jgi:hypothetical protein
MAVRPCLTASCAGVQRISLSSNAGIFGPVQDSQQRIEAVEQLSPKTAMVPKEVRQAIQNSPESIRTLARIHGINPKTVAKWKNRVGVEDRTIDRAEPCSRSLTIEEENMAVSFRRHAMLPLDDCLYALQISVPHLTRSSLHRCFQRHGISRIPKIEIGTDGLRDPRPDRIGSFLISLTELRTAEGRQYLYAATDRISKFTFAQMVSQPSSKSALTFLDALIAVVPYRIHLVLTSNRVQSTFPIRHLETPTGHFETQLFGRRCTKLDIVHQVYTTDSGWSGNNDEQQKSENTSENPKHFSHESSRELDDYVSYFLRTFNYKRKLKSLRGLTPHQFICKIWGTHPELFISNPYHPPVGPIRYSKRPSQRAI